MSDLSRDELLALLERRATEEPTIVLHDPLDRGDLRPMGDENLPEEEESVAIPQVAISDGQVYTNPKATVPWYAFIVESKVESDPDYCKVVIFQEVAEPALPVGGPLLYRRDEIEADCNWVSYSDELRALFKSLIERKDRILSTIAKAQLAELNKGIYMVVKTNGENLENSREVAELLSIKITQ